MKELYSLEKEDGSISITSKSLNMSTQALEHLSMTFSLNKEYCLPILDEQ
jgi:hypothetical protein